LDLRVIDELVDFYLRRARSSEVLSVLDSFQTVDFGRQFNLMSIQRLLKALGTYAYQIIVRENFIYEQYMAGSLHRALLSLDAIPEFPVIRAIVENELKSRGFR
jgi:hypothetical protein